MVGTDGEERFLKALELVVYCKGRGGRALLGAASHSLEQACKSKR